MATCDATYPYLPLSCDLDAGHIGQHEDRTYEPPATYVWED